MRRPVAVLAALALTLLIAVPADAGKRSYSFDTGITSETDCTFQITFSWSSFPASQSYIAHARVAYDGTQISGLQYSWAYRAGTDTVTTANQTFDGLPVAAQHNYTFTFSLITQGNHPRTVLLREVTVPTHCTNIVS